GIGRLPQRLAEQGAFEVRTGVTVRELHRIATGFELVTGPTSSPERITTDEVVLAIPAAPTARLLKDIAPTASNTLSEIEYASMAIVTMAFPAAAIAQLRDSGSSGFLVPPIDGRRIKAATFSFNKWDWVREAGDGVLLLRTSLGRHREEAALQLSDDELVQVSREDLATATGVEAQPIDAHVQRWGGALPQYAVGHLDRVQRIRATIEQVDGLVLCGAAYDGIGIPAVISSAQKAVAQLVGA
ncbi:MAG: protoporphyrinogen oxidase, partial [Nocardioides sp.]|nr:protoporphyrinogen oxidase [Nocardioides sp.]